MCTSDTDRVKKRAAKTALAYLLAALFCALFGAVYELFSHEVYSFYMIYAFAFPLAGGALPFLVLSLKRGGKYPNGFVRNFYHAGIATLTVGSLLCGVLEIYGTTNSLSSYYWIAGIALLAAGITAYIIQCVKEIYIQNNHRGS